MPKILDACCGSRMFWFDKNNPDVVFADNRKNEKGVAAGFRLATHIVEKGGIEFLH